MAFSSSASSNVIFAPPNIGHLVSIKLSDTNYLIWSSQFRVHQNLLMVLLIQHIFSGIRKISQTSLPLNPEPVYTT
ncbi:hypothetical protein AAG906_029227 [Vitis piasezkii]